MTNKMLICLLITKILSSDYNIIQDIHDHMANNHKQCMNPPENSNLLLAGNPVFSASGQPDSNGRTTVQVSCVDGTIYMLIYESISALARVPPGAPLRTNSKPSARDLTNARARCKLIINSQYVLVQTGKDIRYILL